MSSAGQLSNRTSNPFAAESTVYLGHRYNTQSLWPWSIRSASTTIRPVNCARVSAHCPFHRTVQPASVHSWA